MRLTITASGKRGELLLQSIRKKPMQKQQEAALYYANCILKTADGSTLMAGRTIMVDGIVTGNGNDDAWVMSIRNP